MDTSLPNNEKKQKIDVFDRHEANQNKADREFKTRNEWRDSLNKDRQQGMIWRALGNSALNNMPMWFITLTVKDKSLDWIEKQSVLRQNMPNLLKAWRRGVKRFAYALIVSGGDSGHNPHYHIFANAPLPDNWQCDDIKADSKLVNKAELDREKLARYSAKNLNEDSEFTSQKFRKSKTFYQLANPAAKHLYRPIKSSLYVYITNWDKSSFSQERILHFKSCRYCHEVLPETSNYFQRRGKNFRSECKHCYVLMLKASRCNDSHSYAGKIDLDVWMIYCLSRRVKDCYRDVYDGELVTLSELSIDHMNCVASGGKNVNQNVCLTSIKNNRKKSDMSFNAWIRLLYASGIENEFTPYVNCSDMTRQKRLFA